MKHRSFNYLRAYRKRWSLSEEDVAGFLGAATSGFISRFESGKRTPPLEVVLAYEVVFGIPARVLFPDLYEAVEEAVMGRAAELSVEFEAQSDHASLRKRQLLADMVKRAGGNAAEL